MTNYMKECTKDYINALIKAEKLLKEAEHDVWQNDGTMVGLYNISCKLREALEGVSEEMYQLLIQEEEL